MKDNLLFRVIIVFVVFLCFFILVSDFIINCHLDGGYLLALFGWLILRETYGKTDKPPETKGGKGERN